MAYKIKGNVEVSGSSLKVNTIEVLTESGSQVVQNKTINADLNTISNIDNADIKAGAAIDAAKIADGSVSSTEFQYLNGVTSPLQDQLDDKADAALLENNIYVGDASDLAAAVDTSALGDIEASTAAGLQIKAGAILNADVNASAAIAYSKLAALTASRALQSSAGGVVEASAVSSTELGYLSGVTSAIQTQLNGKLSLTGGTMSGDIAMGGNKVTGLGAPTGAADAATKGYVDAVAEGLKPKTAARVATDVAGTLASDFEDGDTVDGIVLATGDRLLIKDQVAAEENGIYIVQASGAPVRSTDFDSLSPIDEINGAMVAVQEGTENAGKIFVQSGVVTTIGVDPIDFIFFNSSSGLVGGDGITISGSNVSVDHDGEGLQFSANQLALELDGSSLSKSASGLRVANLGVDTAQLAAASVTEAKLNASVAGDGIAGGAGTALSVDHDGQGLTFAANQLALELDGSTLSKSASGLKVADLGIANAQIDTAAAIARSKLASGNAHRILVNDAGGAFGEAAALTNGQLLIGSTGAAPVAAALTAGAGISITNGAGSITVASVNASAGDLPETSFSAANNQGAAADVTGFVFANATVRSFEALVSIALDATADLFEVRTLRGIQKGASWDMSETSNGDDTGVVFTITNAGQIQYTSNSSAGFVSNTIKFRAITTSV